LWSRSQFSTYSKVDYETNNLAESFNNWVKQYKGLNLADFFLQDLPQIDGEMGFKKDFQENASDYFATHR
jgi:hypothetical protein